MKSPQDLPTPGAEHLAAALDAPDVLALRDRVQACIPGYTLLNCLGRGGMGAVFRAHHLRLDRTVAIKVLLPAPDAVTGWEDRFRLEARALARLSHPGIVTVHDYGQVEDLCWIVMEYVDGASLRELMQQGRLTTTEALGVVPQVCSALQYAHDQGVVHRDLKPENVLIDEHGAVRIADFGLAKMMDVGPSMRLTLTDQAMGTLRYMAPEQLERPKEVDHRADIFSLGVVLYEMLTGQVPAGAVQPPSAKGCDDPRFDEVVMRSMEREPEERFQRAAELEQRLELLRQAGAPPEVTSGDTARMPRREAAADELGARQLRKRLRISSILLAFLTCLSFPGQWGNHSGVTGLETPAGLLCAAGLLGIVICLISIGDRRSGRLSALSQMGFGLFAAFFAFGQSATHSGRQVAPVAALGLTGMLVLLAVLQFLFRDPDEVAVVEDGGVVLRLINRIVLDLWIALAGSVLVLATFAANMSRLRYELRDAGLLMAMVILTIPVTLILHRPRLPLAIASTVQVLVGCLLVVGSSWMSGYNAEGMAIMGMILIISTVPRWIRFMVTGKKRAASAS